MYRLPTESEWEFSCRAGSETAFLFGDSLDADQTNILDAFSFGDAEKGPLRNRTTATDSFKPNAFAFYDICGNVVRMVFRLVWAEFLPLFSRR